MNLSGKRVKRLAIGVSVAAPLVCTLIPADDVEATVTTRTVALSGELAPGIGPGVIFSHMTAPAINALGQTAFRAGTTGPGIDSTNNFGMWSEAGGALDLVALRGDALPGAVGGDVLRLFGNPIPNAMGQTAFVGSLNQPGVSISDDYGYWVMQDGSLQPLVIEGDPAPDTAGGVTFSSFLGSSFVSSQRTLFNQNGQTAFKGTLIGPGVSGANSLGIWSGGIGTLGLVSRGGDAAPGTEAGTIFSGYSHLAFNALGDTAFVGFLSGPAVDGSNEQGIWAGGAGALSLVTRSGDAAPGTPAGTVFGTLNANYGIKFNAQGQTAFSAGLQGPDVDSTNSEGIWSGGAGSVNLVARRGDAAPGTDPGVVFSGLSEPIFNGVGQTAFAGFLSGAGVDQTNAGGIWLETAGSLDLVVREGDAVPGAGPGVVFDSFFTPVLNNVGQVAFEGVLSGPGVDATNNEGIWATGPDGNLMLIVREGDLFDIDDNPAVTELRTIGSQIDMIWGTGNEDGGGTSFNDAGQLAFVLQFVGDGWGTFVASTRPTGDLNGDGFVGIEDLNIILGNWNQSVPLSDPMADPTGDGFVGIEDLNLVLGNWNAGTPPDIAGVVPEPTTVGVLVVGLGMLAIRRARRA